MNLIVLVFESVYAFFYSDLVVDVDIYIYIYI